MKTRMLAIGLLAAASLLTIGSAFVGEASAAPCVYVTDPLTGYDVGCWHTYCPPGEELHCYVGTP